MCNVCMYIIYNYTYMYDDELYLMIYELLYPLLVVFCWGMFRDDATQVFLGILLYDSVDGPNAKKTF